jgi:hypothetical protein
MTSPRTTYDNFCGAARPVRRDHEERTPELDPAGRAIRVLEGTFATEADAVGSEERIYTDEFPVYTASEWAIARETTPIVVATLHD